MNTGHGTGRLGGWGMGLLILLALPLSAATPAERSSCITCHQKVTPGIVEQFLRGKMGQPDAEVDCADCHGDEHTTAEDWAKARIPTPETCAECHEEKVEEFKNGKHALAWAAMKAMPMVSHQPIAITGEEGFKGCSGCHKIGIKPEEDIRAGKFRYGTGSCDACHTRHTFSVEEARDPRACMTCHMGFDHPQWEMWSSSKHGVIWQIEGNTGRAPTCQTCHMQDGNHAVMTAWGFLALRVPEDDPAWWRDRVTILQALGVLDDEGNPTERFDAVKAAKLARLTREAWQVERQKMLKVCTRCHSRNYAENQLASADSIIRASDALMAEAIRTVQALYRDGILRKPRGAKYAPDLLQFYENPTSIEQDLYVMFLEYRMRAFQGAFHMNPDYMHWYGWARMKETLRKIKDEARRLREEHKGR